MTLLKHLQVLLWQCRLNAHKVQLQQCHLKGLKVWAVITLLEHFVSLIASILFKCPQGLIVMMLLECTQSLVVTRSLKHPWKSHRWSQSLITKMIAKIIICLIAMMITESNHNNYCLKLWQCFAPMTWDHMPQERMQQLWSFRTTKTAWGSQLQSYGWLLTKSKPSFDETWQSTFKFASWSWKQGCPGVCLCFVVVVRFQKLNNQPHYNISHNMGVLFRLKMLALYNKNNFT